MSNVPRWAVLATACAAALTAVAGCSSDSAKNDDDSKQAKGAKGSSAAPSDPSANPSANPSSNSSANPSASSAASGGAPSGTPRTGSPPARSAPAGSAPAGSAPARSAPAGSPTPPPPSGSIPVGPGPQPSYAVQQQPAAGSCHYRFTPAKEPLPDPACTPGATNPKVTRDTLKTTICRSGYTAGIRPPTNITSRQKTANAAAYGYKGPLGDAEYTHLIGLQLGGDPNDPRNLWVVPPSPGRKAVKGAGNPKDVVETRLKDAVCSGKADLVKAQQAVARDWTTALDVLGVPGKPAKGGTTSLPDDDG
ncbi:hypothetical protein [Streptomyces roseifaciens]|uniref:hypothetical protein n=1 Tax=Streptomyces roseifaciens TaxID=1488406 RepID=UPI000717F3E4|nr:hypothetical protein [Streptomyces roseifaciens]